MSSTNDKSQPYTPYFHEGSRWWKVKGPTEVAAGWTREDHAQEHANDLNAAYAAGQAAMWLPLTEENQPERNSTAIYWTPELDGSIESGYLAIADEWRWEHHAKHATHFLRHGPPTK